MNDEEEHGGQQKKVGDLNNLTTLECEGVSEVNFLFLKFITFFCNYF